MTQLVPAFRAKYYLPFLRVAHNPVRDRPPGYRAWRDWDPQDRESCSRYGSRQDFKHYDPQVRLKKKRQREARRLNYRRTA